MPSFSLAQFIAHLLNRHHSQCLTQRTHKAETPNGDSSSQVEYQQLFRDFDLEGKAYAVTGEAQGLGLRLAEALVRAGNTGMSILPTPQNPKHAIIS